MNKFKRLHVPEWPQSDRELWATARKAAGPFDNGGRAAAWSNATIRSVECGYGTYLAWLTSTLGLQADATPLDRVTEDRLRQFLDAYAPGRAPLTVAGMVRGIAYFYRATIPPAGQPWLTKLAHRMTNSASPSRPKLPRMASLSELIEVGYRLMGTGREKLALGNISGAPEYRDGLMIAALAARPALRRRNLCDLRIGHSFHQTEIGFCVKLSGKDTKKGVRIEFQYPSWLNEAFDIYLREVRPVLHRRQANDAGWLWIGRRGNRLPADNITTNFTNATERYLGRSISPHPVRDCAATDIALHDPLHVGITKDILGHKTLASSQEHYNQANNVNALSKLSAVLTAIIER
ncbi:MAG: tyrosine-type recombinase/integrase [Proteobacteria bacterium]|nr:tyrosine-type recombinase/integrase [Pseudomonadota bacterium]